MHVVSHSKIQRDDDLHTQGALARDTRVIFGDHLYLYLHWIEIKLKRVISTSNTLLSTIIFLNEKVTKKSLKFISIVQIQF